jgi:hypothetical protein
MRSLALVFLFSSLSAFAQQATQLQVSPATPDELHECQVNLTNSGISDADATTICGENASLDFQLCVEEDMINQKIDATTAAKICSGKASADVSGCVSNMTGAMGIPTADATTICQEQMGGAQIEAQFEAQQAAAKATAKK